MQARWRGASGSGDQLLVALFSCKTGGGCLHETARKGPMEAEDCTPRARTDALVDDPKMVPIMHHHGEKPHHFQPEGLPHPRRHLQDSHAQ